MKIKPLEFIAALVAAFVIAGIVTALVSWGFVAVHRALGIIP